MAVAGKVLHVDDDEHTLRLVARHLQGAGFSVVSTSSPFIAPIIEQERPDIIVMDVDMPLLPGDKIVTILRGNEFSTIPILYFSGKPINELESMAARISLCSFLQKSAGLPALVAKLHAMIP